MRLTFFFIFFSVLLFGQQRQNKLAYQYYINGEYSRAIEIYEDIYKNEFSSVDYRTYIFCLFTVQNYKAAELLAQRAFRSYPSNLTYQLEIAIAQEKQGKIKKSTQTYNKLFDKINGQVTQTVSLANVFKNYTMYSKALYVYELAEKQNKKSSFRMQKAELYLSLEKIDLMMESYLQELYASPSMKKIITQRIQHFLNNNGIKNEDNFQLVKKKLLPYVRDEINRSDFSEILIWVFMQNSQYEMALRQAMALDKRSNSNGEEVYYMGDFFLDKENFLLAVDAYEYIISKGRKNFLYIDASINRLYALTKNISSKTVNINIIDEFYKKAIIDLGKNSNTVLLLSNYAHFKAFYMHDLISAQEILEEAMSIPQITKLNLAECKLEYADVMLLSDNVWDALLYYSQVEKSFKESPLGHEAKLRAAKVSYYQGDFDWAQAQLEVLKTSTSKLIANDALDLSLLIIDNLNLDTTNTAMELFSKADLLKYQQKYSESILQYDSLLSCFPSHSLTDEVYMRKAEIYIKLDNISEAIKMYNNIIEEWSYDILADDAIYLLARLYDSMLNDQVKAQNLYERIIVEYNSSIFASESRRRFREIRGDKIQ